MHEQLMQVRSMLNEEGIGKQGHSRSASDNARALLHVAVHQQHGLSFDAATKATATAELASPFTLRAAVQQLVAAGTLATPSTVHRGRGNPSHPLHSSNTDEYGPSLEAELLMHELVHTQKTDGDLITSTTIAAELRERLDIKIDQYGAVLAARAWLSLATQALRGWHEAAG